MTLKDTFLYFYYTSDEANISESFQTNLTYPIENGAYNAKKFTAFPF